MTRTKHTLEIQDYTVTLMLIEGGNDARGVALIIDLHELTDEYRPLRPNQVQGFMINERRFNLEHPEAPFTTDMEEQMEEQEYLTQEEPDSGSETEEETDPIRRRLSFSSETDIESEMSQAVFTMEELLQQDMSSPPTTPYGNIQGLHYLQ